MKKILIAFLLLFSLSFCHKDNSPFSKYIYKTKGDYSNLVCCILKNDNIHIAAIIGVGGNLKRLKLSQNYVFYQEGLILKNNNVAFLSLTQDVYNAKYNTDTVRKYHINWMDSIEKHYILDKDPFIELYGLQNNINVDTSNFNEIIRKGELDKYFKKIK